MNYPELNVFKDFRQVIVWGFPLHTHTHSYIHGAWVKTFQYLGVKVHWFHDKEYPKEFDYTNTCFITEGWADDNIPVNNSSTYFVHIAKNPAKYLSVGARLIEIRYNVLEINDFNYEYKLPENPLYLSRDTLYEKVKDDSAVAKRRGRSITSNPYEVVYMYWATDLLPHEFNYSDAELINNSNIINYIGSVGGTHPFFEFKRLAEQKGYAVKHINPWSTPISYDDNIKLMKNSYCVPDFRSNGDRDNYAKYGKMNGTNHLDIGYIPCRVLKAISYGRTGITNSKRVKELLGEYVEYAETAADVFHINELRKFDIEWRKSCMKYVSENHTFLQRARDLARAIQMKSYQTTCVTAIYDIGREKIDGRKILDYKEWLITTLRTIRDPFVLYLDSSLGWKKDILLERTSIGPIQVIETNLSDIPMWKYKGDVSRIMELSEFKKIQKHPNDITNLLPEYCLVQYSKFDWVYQVSESNPYNSMTYVWIDAGYSRLYPTNNSYIFNTSAIDKFTVQADNTISRVPNLTCDNYIGTNERIFQGGLWYTTKMAIVRVRELMYNIWEREMINKNRLDNEQIILVLIYKISPELFTIVKSSGTIPSLFSNYTI